MVREVKLYEIPKTLQTARVLDGSVLEAYNDSVMSAYNSEKARQTLSKFKKENGELTGSSPFIITHLQNSGLLLQQRIATRQDLETAKGLAPDFLSGNYVDFGLALKTAGDSYAPNDLLAKTLGKQLKERGIKLGKGKFIPISALSLREDENSGYGLVFCLDGEVKDIKDLSDNKWDYSIGQGLARACLDRYGDWGSDGGILGDSDGDGRIVVVSGEAAPQNFLVSKMAELQKRRDAEMSKIQERYARAEKLLRGE